LLAYFIFCFIIYSGPGAYNNEEKTTFRYVLDQQPMSRRGYTFNARTEKRKTFEPKVICGKLCFIISSFAGKIMNDLILLFK
jgi:hypothetical protein